MADSVEKLEDVIVRSAEQVSGQIRAAKEAVATVIFGQDKVVENTLVTILAGGHALLIGVPGLAKTKLVETLGVTLGLDAKRIQFTPDLMPSDILGAEVLDESSTGKRSFRFIAGPVFAQLLMADEINRASPRTQSALLQAMQEQHITVAGARHDLPKPLPDGDRCRLSRSRRRAAHPVRDHRRRRDAGQGRHERRDPAHGAAAGATAAGRRFRGRSHPVAGSVRAPPSG